MVPVDTRDGRPSPEETSSSDADVRPPAVLMISIAGLVGLGALAAAWTWVTHGSAILLDIADVFCF